ncbi:MAG: DUF2332 domain-containing protein [Hyphomonadaceae bacterium]|nr:DUF2332 domain-containing protein [Hyphomonadaceae bacterium]
MSTVIPDMDMGDYFRGSVMRFNMMRAPLYAALAEGVAEDPDLCAMAARKQTGQPADHLLFSAAELVLQDNASDPLAAYYPTMTAQPKPAAESFPAFRAFCLKHRQAIEALIATRTVQTTFLNRAGLIAPAARLIADEVGEPLSLIEIGCSAGLLTLFDHYQYDLGPEGRHGDASRPAVEQPHWFGDARPKSSIPPKIGARVGLDLNPVDPTGELERRWIESLAPPDWVSQRKQLAAALRYRADTGLRTIAGDAMKSLPGLLTELPAPIMVMHTFCLYQWPAEPQVALDARLREASKTRTIHRLAIDIVTGARPPELEPFNMMKERLFDMYITRYEGGEARTKVIGECDPWGFSAQWLA